VRGGPENPARAWTGGPYPRRVDLTVDAFHALARSSPWRWSRLHFRHRSDGLAAGVEAWVVRPGWLLVRAPGQPDHIETGVPYTRGWVSVGSPGWTPPEPRSPQEVVPPYRPDGLVAERPTAVEIDYDDPLYPGASFTWVAMLDPQELSHDVAVSDLRREERAGRETWRATVRAEEGYEARCPDCCDLLLGGFVQRLPYDVALDVGTGIVVSLAPLDGDRDHWLRNEIVAADEDVVVPPPVG
jgi:hypothetical protein